MSTRTLLAAHQQDVYYARVSPWVGYANANSYSYSNLRLHLHYSYSYSYGHIYGYTYSYSQTDAHGEIWADAESPAHAAALPRAMGLYLVLPGSCGLDRARWLQENLQRVRCANFGLSLVRQLIGDNSRQI